MKGEPCGQCDTGTYALVAVLFGLAKYSQCKSQKEALKTAPRCKFDKRRICNGARDFIVGTTFPMSDEQLMTDIQQVLT